MSANYPSFKECPLVIRALSLISLIILITLIILMNLVPNNPSLVPVVTQNYKLTNLIQTSHSFQMYVLSKI